MTESLEIPVQIQNAPCPFPAESIYTMIWQALYFTVSPRQGNPDNLVHFYGRSYKRLGQAATGNAPGGAGGPNAEVLRFLAWEALNNRQAGEINQHSDVVDPYLVRAMAELVGLRLNIWGDDLLQGATDRYYISRIEATMRDYLKYWSERNEKAAEIGLEQSL